MRLYDGWRAACADGGANYRTLVSFSPHGVRIVVATLKVPIKQVQDITFIENTAKSLFLYCQLASCCAYSHWLKAIHASRWHKKTELKAELGAFSVSLHLLIYEDSDNTVVAPRCRQVFHQVFRFFKAIL